MQELGLPLFTFDGNVQYQRTERMISNERQPIQSAKSRRPRLLAKIDNGPWHDCRDCLERSFD